MNHAPKTAIPEEAAALIELYFEKGWTDGLPVVPPSAASVQAMLAAAGLEGGTLVGEVAVRNTRITAEKVAINAVMAGCLPQYMPVLTAAVKALCDPDFGYHGVATSTGGASVVVIVNGPVAGRLGINARDNAFGPGCRSNMTIGRALRLLMMNAINTRPGKLDRSTLGSPGKISFCFAENEAASPWEPLHVERGFAASESTTTLFAADGILQTYNQLSRTPEALLTGMADAMANMGSMTIVGQAQMLVVLGGEHTEVLRQSGWTKKEVKRFLYGQARRTVADLKRAGRLPGEIGSDDASTWRHPLRDPDDILLVCAGGAAGSFSACLPGWGSRNASRSVTIPVLLS
ncbi:MAG: hypothetical protein MUP74_03615 [Desulfobacterales bacterium]|nr:hypothetical protein [Desulfobacterales bacterium]